MPVASTHRPRRSVVMFVRSRAVRRGVLGLVLAEAGLLIALGALPAGAQPVAPSQQDEFQSRVEEKDWDGAIAAGHALVATARQEPVDPARLSAALVSLGSAQQGKGDYVAAELAFAEALSILEPISSSADSRLVEPLRGMGFALAAQSKHADAVPYMEKALAIARRSHGLFDVGQRDLLRTLADSLAEVGKPEAANQHMQYLERIGEHAYGANDPRIVPLLCTMGDWYAQRGQILEARDYFRRALSIVVKKNGEGDLAAVEPLRGYARSFIREMVLSHYGIRVQADMVTAGPDIGSGDAKPIAPQYLNADGERALLRALAILEGKPDRPLDAWIETLLQMGDWYQTKGQWQRAQPFYQRALSSLPADADPAVRNALLGFPVHVYYPTPQLAARNLGRPPHEVTERFVQVEFTVMPDGSVKDEHVVDQDATSRQVSQTLEAIHASRFRPKFADGQPVETLAVRYRQTFRQKKDSE